MMISRSTASRVAKSVLHHAGPRYFSAATSLGGAAKDAASVRGYTHDGAARFWSRNLENASGKIWTRFPVVGVCKSSTMALGEKQRQEEEKVHSGASGGAAAIGGGNGNKGVVVSYWGVEPAKITKEDGTEWKWNCFRPCETYKSNTSIDLKKHHAPVTWMDKIAFWTVKALRLPTDLFFQKRYGCRAMMLETVAAVPGMVGGMLLHCKVPTPIRAQRWLDQSIARRSGE